MRNLFFLVRILEGVKRLFGPVLFWLAVFVACIAGVMWASGGIASAQVACTFGYDLDGEVTSVGSNARSQTAQAITTGADGCDLETFSISVSKESGRSDDLQLSIYSDNAGEPDAVLASATPIPASAIATGFGNEALETTPITYTLEPSTTYWLVAEGSGSLNDDIVYYVDRGTDGGTTFEYLPNAGAWTTGNASYNLLISVDGFVSEEETATSTNTSTEPDGVLHLFLGILLFFISAWFIIWIFKRV